MHFGQISYDALCQRAKELKRRLEPKEVIETLQLEYEKALGAKIPRKERDRLFDALAEACHFTPPFTKSAAGQIARAIKEILEVNPTVTPEEMLRRARIILKKFDGRGGPMAVAAHWHEVSSTPRTTAAKTDPYVEPPVVWRVMAAAKYPDAANWGNPHDFATMPWSEVSISLRPDILKLVYA